MVLLSLSLQSMKGNLTLKSWLLEKKGRQCEGKQCHLLHNSRLKNQPSLSCFLFCLNCMNHRSSRFTEIELHFCLISVGVSHTLHLRTQSLCHQWCQFLQFLVVVTISFVVLVYVVPAYLWCLLICVSKNEVDIIPLSNC